MDSSSGSHTMKRRRRLTTPSSASASSLFLLLVVLLSSSFFPAPTIHALLLPASTPSLHLCGSSSISRSLHNGALRMSDEAFYGEGGDTKGGANARKTNRRPTRPPPPPVRRTDGEGGGGGGGGGGSPRRGVGDGVPQRDMTQLIERTGQSEPAWKRAVNLDEVGLVGGRDLRPPRSRPQGGGGGGQRHQGGGRGPGGAANGYRGKGGGGGRRPVQQKKSWWTSEFNKMDGELEVPLPWWAEGAREGGMEGEWKYGERKVVELKEELARRGAKVSGTKAELIERLESLDKLYTLTDDGFREVTILHDKEEESNLPPCFPSTYGDEFEQRLLEEQEAGVDVKNYAP